MLLLRGRERDLEKDNGNGRDTYLSRRSGRAGDGGERPERVRTDNFASGTSRACVFHARREKLRLGAAFAIRLVTCVR